MMVKDEVVSLTYKSYQELGAPFPLFIFYFIAPLPLLFDDASTKYLAEYSTSLSFDLLFERVGLATPYSSQTLATLAPISNFLINSSFYVTARLYKALVASKHIK
ncbi:hypothetical protein E2C01_055656 [Portunus trituberculatus]|uniref:Uncharacterized protein n=1 Tax=Portunus trituberculatus TaxID=210409 RepID=A0A5B7GRU3_PORTR|nr:hypothetical protein [Portunus trituberculatus]